MNDELFDKVNEPTISRIRIGVPDSCTGRLMSSIVAGLRDRIPSHGLVIVCEHPEILIRQMLSQAAPVYAGKTLTLGTQS